MLINNITPCIFPIKPISLQCSLIQSAIMKKIIVYLLPLLLFTGFSLVPASVSACGSNCCKKEKPAVAEKAAAKSCCAAKSTDTSGCKMSKSGAKCKSDCGEQPKKDCSGKCKNCPTCTTASASAALIEDYGFNLLPRDTFKRTPFYYQYPYLPNISIDIWQPPKIAV